MHRREHLEKLLSLGCCACMLPFGEFGTDGPVNETVQTDELKILKSQKEFIQNWLSDLLDSMENVVDEQTRVKIIEGCGKACFKKHKFKTDFAVHLT